MNLQQVTVCSQCFLATAAQVSESLLALNEETAAHGLILTAEQAREVAAARSEALKETGRVDFSGEIPVKLARAFCDSPYLMQSSYAAQLCELVALFYEARGDTEDRISDDALIAKMRFWFDDPAQGEIERLRELLWRFARRLEAGDQACEIEEGEPDARAWAMDGRDVRDWYLD